LIDFRIALFLSFLMSFGRGSFFSGAAAGGCPGNWGATYAINII